MGGTLSENEDYESLAYQANIVDGILIHSNDDPVAAFCCRYHSIGAITEHKILMRAFFHCDNIRN